VVASTVVTTLEALGEARRKITALEEDNAQLRADLRVADRKLRRIAAVLDRYRHYD